MTKHSGVDKEIKTELAVELLKQIYLAKKQKLIKLLKEEKTDDNDANYPLVEYEEAFNQAIDRAIQLAEEIL